MRVELWEKRADALRPFSGKGIALVEIAKQTGLTPQTVRSYGDRFGFDFGVPETAPSAKTPNASAIRLQKLRACAEKGMTRVEAAETVGLTYGSIHQYCRRYNLEFRRPEYPNKGPADEGRADAMASMYRAGKTLEQIGQLYGVTRERVRQVISKCHGLNADSGGARLKAKITRQSRTAQREAACLRKNGCTLLQMKELRAIGKQMIAKGHGAYRTPIRAFECQRNNAKSRQIPWNLKLWEWWQIWQRSGKWSQRGREVGNYVMCRFGDTGAYEIGNVYIATVSHNLSLQPNNPNRLSHPRHAEVMEARRAAA